MSDGERPFSSFFLCPSSSFLVSRWTVSCMLCMEQHGINLVLQAIVHGFVRGLAWRRVCVLAVLVLVSPEFSASVQPLDIGTYYSSINCCTFSLYWCLLFCSFFLPKAIFRSRPIDAGMLLVSFLFPFLFSFLFPRQPEYCTRRSERLLFHDSRIGDGHKHRATKSQNILQGETGGRQNSSVNRAPVVGVFPFLFLFFLVFLFSYYYRHLSSPLLIISLFFSVSSQCLLFVALPVLIIVIAEVFELKT